MFNKIVTFLGENWVMITLIVGALIQIINMITKSFKDRESKLAKVLLWITEVLSVVCSVDEKFWWKFKPPLVSGKQIMKVAGIIKAKTEDPK